MAGVAAASTLASCIPSPPNVTRRTAQSTRSDKVQIVYQDWRTDWFPPMAQRMLEKFHEAHPNIRVFYTLDPENVEEQMLVDMQAGTAPDVFAGCCSSFPIWAQKGYTLDLRPYVEADLASDTIGDWDPVQYRSFFNGDGHQFGLPKYHGALALYFNIDLFDEYRVPYPNADWDHQDYLSAMTRLTDDRNGDDKTDLWGSMIDISWERVQVHVNEFGGNFVDPKDPSRSLMAEAPAMDAMEWLRARIWDDRVMPTSLDVNKMGTSQAFSAGRLAMVEDGSWALKPILSTAKFRVGVVPFPKGPDRRATLATTDGFGIFAGTRHPEAAWELMKFLISKDYGRAMAEAHLLQPARFSLIDEWTKFIRSEYPKQAAGMDIAAFAEGHQRGYSVIAETFSNMSDARRIVYEAWDQIFTLGRSGVDAMRAASKLVEDAQHGPKTGGTACSSASDGAACGPRL